MAFSIPPTLSFFYTRNLKIFSTFSFVFHYIIIFFIFIMTKNNNGLVGWTKYGNFVRKKRHVFCGSAHNNNHTLEIEDQIKLFIRFLLRKAIKYQDIVGYMKYSIYCLFPIYYWLVNPVIFYSISPFDARGVRILFVNCSRKLIFLARSRRCCALRLSIMVETEASDSSSSQRMLIPSFWARWTPEGKSFWARARCSCVGEAGF